MSRLNKEKLPGLSYFNEVTTPESGSCTFRDQNDQASG